jgi:hypothetical protein
MRNWKKLLKTARSEKAKDCMASSWNYGNTVANNSRLSYDISLIIYGNKEDFQRNGRQL